MFTLARYRSQFRTKLARLVMKKIIFVSKTCKLNAKSRAKIANVKAPSDFMDKLKLSGQNLGRVFNSRHGRTFATRTYFTVAKLPNLKWKTWPKQLLGLLPLALCSQIGANFHFHTFLTYPWDIHIFCQNVTL